MAKRPTRDKTPLNIGDLVQLSSYGLADEPHGIVVRVEGPWLWARDDNGVIHKAHFGRASWVPKPEEIWGEGGLAEQVRNTWSKADRRRRQTGDTVVRMADTLIFPDEYFEEPFLW